MSHPLIIWPVRVVALCVVALTTCATGGVAPVSSADACHHTDVVFYTSDTIRLATELAKTPAPCTDYYVVINSPSGFPRGGAPITAIRSLGPQFHAMSEIRLKAWGTYASANGWYAAGVEARRQMRALNYDAGLGDTWALNEVGAPSDTTMGVDVFKNNGTARQDSSIFSAGSTRAMTVSSRRVSSSQPISRR